MSQTPHVKPESPDAVSLSTDTVADASQAPEAAKFEPSQASAAEDATPARLVELERELAQANATIARLERRRQIDQQLERERTIDRGLARLLTEATLETMDEPDARLAVEQLKRTRPYLFEPTGPLASASSPHPDPDDQSDDPDAPALEAAADRAARSGHRRDLLRYLRLRRDRLGEAGVTAETAGRR